MKQEFIKSGQWLVRKGNTVIRTDLGSCVALCLWDHELRIGGMNHYLLPGTLTSEELDPNLGSYSNERLLVSLLNQGASITRLRAAVVGGGSIDAGSYAKKIGDANVAAAIEILERNGIPVQYKRTGGTYSRHVTLNVETGEISVREIALGSGLVRLHQVKMDK